MPFRISHSPRPPVSPTAAACGCRRRLTEARARWRSPQWRLPLGWGLPRRVWRGRRLGWRLLDLWRLHTPALARCNVSIDCPQLVASGLGRLTKLGFLPPIEAPLSAFRAGAGLNSLRENHRKPRNYRPHACRSPAVLMAASSVNTSNRRVSRRDGANAAADDCRSSRIPKPA